MLATPAHVIQLFWSSRLGLADRLTKGIEPYAQTERIDNPRRAPTAEADAIAVIKGSHGR